MGSIDDNMQIGFRVTPDESASIVPLRYLFLYHSCTGNVDDGTLLQSYQRDVYEKFHLKWLPWLLYLFLSSCFSLIIITSLDLSPFIMYRYENEKNISLEIKIPLARVYFKIDYRFIKRSFVKCMYIYLTSPFARLSRMSVRLCLSVRLSLCNV